MAVFDSNLLARSVLIFIAALGTAAYAQSSVPNSKNIGAQTLVNKITTKFRGATVAIRVRKEAKSGAIYETFGSGFFVGKHGHLLTSCHVVDAGIRTEAGVLIEQADKVTRWAAVGSREGDEKKVNWLGCASPPFDIALIKFADTYQKHQDVPVIDVRPEPGDEIAAIGYPLDVEFFPRGGFIGAETGFDTYTVAMPLNKGDSGAPVFNKESALIGIAEGGYPGAGIGIVRPLRHAAGLLSQAGIYLTAINTPINSRPDAGAPSGTKVELATAADALSAFAKGSATLPDRTSTVKVTYPFVRIFDTGTGEGPTSAGARPGNFNLSELQARPGYKITDAKFIVVSQKNANVLNVSVPTEGKVARTSIEKLGVGDGEASFVRGFVETTQTPIVQNLFPK